MTCASVNMCACNWPAQARARAFRIKNQGGIISVSDWSISSSTALSFWLNSLFGSNETTFQCRRSKTSLISSKNSACNILLSLQYCINYLSFRFRHMHRFHLRIFHHFFSTSMNENFSSKISIFARSSNSFIFIFNNFLAYFGCRVSMLFWHPLNFLVR